MFFFVLHIVILSQGCCCKNVLLCVFHDGLHDLEEVILVYNATVGLIFAEQRQNCARSWITSVLELWFSVRKQLHQSWHVQERGSSPKVRSKHLECPLVAGRMDLHQTINCMSNFTMMFTVILGSSYHTELLVLISLVWCSYLKHKMAAPIPTVFWLHFRIIREIREPTFIFCSRQALISLGFKQSQENYK